MNKFFYIDYTQNRKVTYSQILHDLNKQSKFNRYLYTSDYYEIFKNIILSLLLDKEIILLDYDLSETEMKNLTNDKVKDSVDINESLSIPNIEEMFSRINNNKNWRITLYTSGTTGIPKKVQHSFKTITRFVKISDYYEEDIWGFAYNPTHIAGTQVFFQALLNKNTIVKLFDLSFDDIYNSIKEYNINRISATPTFYRLFNFNYDPLSSVKSITIGGEKLYPNVKDRLKILFPEAKIKNIYATTEFGSLLKADGVVFSLKEEYRNLVKVENDELLVHSDLLGEFDSKEKIGDWYRTGDLVEILNDNPLQFKFVSRDNELINVGGYKVNPGEVEELIYEFGNIKESLVYGKKNSVLGNLVYCDVVPKDESFDKKELSNFLRKNLQEFKVPRIINVVDEISKTRSGKIKRT